MSRLHQGKVRVVTSFVRIPEPLIDGKVRCLCGKVVTPTPNGHLRKHKTPKGDACSHWASYRKVELDDLPPVKIREYQPKKEPAPRARSKYKRLVVTGYCHECARKVSGERTFCGPCLARR